MRSSWEHNGRLFKIPMPSLYSKSTIGPVYLSSSPGFRHSLARVAYTYAALLVIGLLLCGCGGGGGSQNPPPPPPTPDFQLGFDNPTVSVQAGSSATTALTATAINGFSSPVSIQISGLPAGVVASPPNATLTPGVAQTFMISAAPNASARTTTVVFTGTSGSLTHTENLQVNVTSGGVGTLSTRTRYVRTDAVTEYYLGLNDHWVVFNSASSRFFVTDPTYNRVIVLDSATETQVATIPVPGAWGIDDTPDHSTLYVGTLIGDVYAIDPTSMTVKHRYLASEIGPYGYPALSVQVMSDGRLALLAEQGGIPSVDGSVRIAVWNPTTNAINIYGSANGRIGVPTLPLCPMGNIGAFTRSGDRTSIFLGSVDSDGTVCQINASTGQLQTVIPGGETFHIIASPDGKYIALASFSTNSVLLYDAHTLAQAGQFAASGDLGSNANLTFSPDSTAIYVSSSGFVYGYRIPGGQSIGWMPNLVVEFTSGGFAVGPITGPNFGSMDTTGLLVGPLEEGFGFLDTTQMHTGAVGTQFTNGFITPATGPVSGATAIQLPDPNNFGALSGMYFGSQPATNVAGNAGIISATTPAGAPGPVNVSVFTADGGMQIIPDGFSYGPTILEVTPDVSTAEGGGTGVIYGYGFGLLSATTIPPDLSVSVGGKTATVVGFNPDAYNIIGQPFPLQSVYYTIPPGAVGSVGVTVTTSSGSATAPAGLTYIAATEQFPLARSALVQGIYDPIRDLYYFTDASKIQVFSLAQKKWLTPISIPAPGGAAQRLWGLALSPDGSKLAVADAQANVVYLVDPANTSSVRTFPIAPSVPQGITVSPAGVAISDTGIVYVTSAVLGGTGFNNYFQLDTNTGVLTPLGITGPGLGGKDLYLRTAISQDNSRVFFNNDGYVFNMDTTTNVLFSASAGPGCCYGNYDLALSKNQIQFTATDYLYDSNLNAESFYSLNDREIESVSYVYGVKLSPDGSLVFQPDTNGIDVLDGRIGNLRNRIALPFALSPNYDALVSDGMDNVLLAITGANGDGVAVVDLTSIAEPPPLPYPAAASSPRRAEDRVAAIGGAHSAAGGASSTTTGRQGSGPRFVPHVTRPHSLVAK
jgi:WD40 repeat protein